MLAATVANANRPKGRAAFKIDDFLIKWDPQAKRDMDPPAMRAALWSLNSRKAG